MGTIAHECDAGRLHINEENLIVEVLDGDRPCKPGEMGELVVTELHNTVMPLVRYRMGDFASLSATPCQCGRTLSVLEGIHGRAYDFVVRHDGKRFHGELLMYVFEEAKAHGLPIGQFQVTQRALDDFLVTIVPVPGFDEAANTAAIAQRMRQFLGTDIRVDFQIVSTIAREKSGKMRVIVGLENAAR
jgi:phenylacetate-CoA ligase